MDVRAAIARLSAREHLAETEMESVMADVMTGSATPAQIGALLMGLRLTGESVDEIVGAARALRRHATAVPALGDVVDTCGTGGDHSDTFNISTAAALIAAGAGARIAKHGNRAMSGTVGGADVLEALGVRIELSPAQAAACLEAAGMVFLYGPAFHPAMRHVAGPRREIGVRTIFNLLGPLANPAGATRQLLGVFGAEWVEPIAEVLVRLGTRRALVVHGQDGLDEITLTAPTRVADVRAGRIDAYRIDAADLGLVRCTPEALRGGDARANAEIIRRILAGTAERAQTDIALVNAAAVLTVAERVRDLAAGLAAARAAIADGRARRALDRLIEASNR